MEYEVIKDSSILKFNLKHQNFNETGQIIRAGARVEGEKMQVNGMRRGLPFAYRVTEIGNNENKYIYTNNLKPTKMEQVEVNSNAEGNTLIDVKKSERLMTTTDLILTALGLAGGYMYAKKKGKNKTTYAIGGAVAGYLASKYIYPAAIKVIKKK